MCRRLMYGILLMSFALTLGVSYGQSVKINFQTQAAPIPEGYLPDTGQAYGDRGNGFSYGWDRDISADTRARTISDPRWNTLIHFSKGAAATWEIALANGEYHLYYVCGDAGYTDQTNSLEVEGVTIPDPNGQTGNFDPFTVTVTVTDGRLTIRPGTGAANAKICFIDITSAKPPTTAGVPTPEDKTIDVPRDTALGWKSGQFAASHDVYVGTSLDDVNTASRTSPKGVLASQGQTTATFDPAGLLAFGQTYYWRVDEVNAPDKPGLYKGDVWSFTAETFAYRIATPIKATASSFSNILTGPDKTIDGSGLNGLDQHATSSSQMWLSKKNVSPIWIQYEFNTPYKLYQMWVWNQNQLSELDFGMGAKDVTIEVSTDGTTWTALANVPEFAQAPGEEGYVHNTIVDFGGVLAKYVKLTIHTNWADGTKQAGLSEVRFFYVPVKAFGPTPASATPGVALDAVLDWRPGREAARHEVSLGTDPNALSKVATVTEHSYALGSAGLEYGRTYYWKVNEVNDAASPSSWTGDVWSFTEIGYGVVEDFESYNDLCSKIF